MHVTPASNNPSTSARLRQLDADWKARFRLQPKLPTSALLSGAMAMACGFGAVMFLMFAFAVSFQRWVPQFVIFTALALALGALNRYAAWHWFEQVKLWSAAREEMLSEIEALRAAHSGNQKTEI